MHGTRPPVWLAYALWAACLPVTALAQEQQPAPDAAAPGAPRVEFPDLAAAREAIVDDRAEPYFSRMRPHDMAAKTGAPIPGGALEAQRAECRKRYRDDVLAFTDAEKEFLRGVIAKLHPALSAGYPRLAASPWSFLKVSRIEGGLPHTRGRHIVLPAGVLERLGRVRERSAEAADANAGGLFVHEQFHVFQRANPRACDALYTDVWGFRRAPRIEGCPALDAVEVVNPDATDLGWAFPVRRGGAVRWIWPRVLFRDRDAASPDETVYRMPGDFRLAAVDLEEAGDGFRVKRDAGGKPSIGALLEIREYAGVFAGSSSLYHPAEAAADLFSTIVVLDAFVPKDALPKESREAMESRLAPFRAWFRDNLK